MTKSRFLHVAATFMAAVSTTNGFMTATTSSRLSTATQMAKAATICPEVPLTSSPTTEIALVALG